MKRELDFKLEQLNERRAELKQDQELVKAEKIEISRQKDQLKVSAITSQTDRHFMFNTEGSYFFFTLLGSKLDPLSHQLESRPGLTSTGMILWVFYKLIKIMF